MATEADEPTRDESSDSGSDSGSESDSGEAQQVEWLATTRAKRSTAGNRMKSMLANEEPAADDDDLELLFAEDGDDDDGGFTDAEKDDSDARMDSSSDDEDADEDAEEDAGEKELERQARERRNAQRKRKAQAAIPAKFRKKVRIEHPPATTASASPAPAQSAPKPPRPKKKSERASWLPTGADMPTRASERQTTRLSKEQLHQQMLEREVKRKKIMEAMERKAKKMEALKKPPLTQAQRLAEAAAVEKRNAKSLNRWEEAEKQREEERLRKIAALQNRKLDGPVVTFWSGIQELDGEQMKNLGKMVAIEEKAPRKKRQSLAATREAGADTASKAGTTVEGANPAAKEVGGQTGDQTKPSAPLPAVAAASTATPPAATPLAPPPAAATAPLQQPSMAPPPSDVPHIAPPPIANTATPVQQATAMRPPSSSPMQPPAPQSQLQPPRGSMAPPPIPPPPTGGGFLAAPNMLAHPFGAPPQIGSQMGMMGMQAPNTQSTQSNMLAPPGTHHTGLAPPSPLSMPQPQPQTMAQPISVPQGTDTAPSGPSVPRPNPTPAAPPLQTQPLPAPLQPTQGKATPASPNTPNHPGDRTPAASGPGKVTRSCIILQNFDEHAIKDKQVQTQILFGRKMNKLASKSAFRFCLSPVPQSRIYSA